MDVIDKFDDVLGSDQGTGKGGTEAEYLTNIEWHLPDGLSISEHEELHILKLEGTSEIYAKNSGRSESSSQCNSEKERNRELLLERNMDVMGKFDDILGSDQGTGKGGTEAECLTKIDTEWHLQDELSISEQEKLQILKLEGTREIYAKNSGRPESSSQCNSEKERNRELLLERNIDVMGKFDDVLGSDQGTGKGGTEAECLTNTVTETHFPDESQNSQLESSDKMYEENGKFEAEKHCLDDKSRDYSSQRRDISNLYAKNEVNIKPAKRMEEEENRIGERIEDRMEKDREIQPKLRNKTAKGESEVTKGKENILVIERHLQHELLNLKMEEFDERYAVTNKVEREKHMPKDKIRRYCSSQIKDINERDKDFPSGMAASGPMNDIFCRDPRAENGGTEQECMREIDNEKIDYDEPSSSNHANMQQRKTIKEAKLQDSNHRIKSTIKRGSTNSYTERGEHKRLRSRGEKQPHGDAEGSALKASKLDFCADRIWSQNQHRNKDNSSVSDKQSENSPSPHINKSQNRHCLVCRSRQAESPQRESTARKKSRPNIPTTVHKAPTSEVRKRDSEYTHSKKLYSTVSDISSKNSPSSYVIKNQSRRLSRKTDKTRTEPLSQEKPIASATSNDSSSRVCKRDSSVFCKQSKISSNSCAINDQRGFKSKQSRSTQKEPLSREKVHASGESTIGQGSTSGLCKRDPQFQHSEMVESSVNHRSKSSLNSHVMENRSRSMQGSSTPSG